jgi:DNA-directed RNA polymerase subunit RPC12/RpoP
MNERARRPILHLKLGGPSRAEPLASPPAPAPAAVYTWKCRPCGMPFIPPREGPDEDAVRCPACNARLGRAGDFRSDPPAFDRLRARAIQVSAAPVAVEVLKKVR